MMEHDGDPLWQGVLDDRWSAVVQPTDTPDEAELLIYDGYSRELKHTRLVPVSVPVSADDVFLWTSLVVEWADAGDNV